MQEADCTHFWWDTYILHYLSFLSRLFYNSNLINKQFYCVIHIYYQTSTFFAKGLYTRIGIFLFKKKFK